MLHLSFEVKKIFLDAWKYGLNKVTAVYNYKKQFIER